MSTLPQTFEHALIGSDFSKLHRADKSSQPTCEGRTINGGCWCGSGGLLTTASHQGALSPREQLRTISSLFFLLHRAPVDSRGHHRKSHNLSRAIWSIRIFFLDKTKFFWTNNFF